MRKLNILQIENLRIDRGFRTLPLVLFFTFTQFVYSADAVLSEADSAADVLLENRSSALELSIQLTEQIALFENKISSLESESGPLDHRLIEPLEGLSALLIEAGLFEEAERLINRRLQLIHVAEGPESLSQLATLADLLANNIRLGKWSEVTKNFENINFLHSRNSEADPSSMLNSLDAIRSWHLTAVYVDEPRSRIDHFQDSRELQGRIRRFAEHSFAENSPQHIPWLYQDAVEQYLIAAIISSEDELGVDARDTILRREMLPLDAYLRKGLNTIKRIGEIVEAMNNAEAKAMAMIYEADFLMLQQNGNAGRKYRSAMDQLAEAGVEQARIDAFFLRPIVLPVSEFYFSLAEAVAAQNAYGYRISFDEDDKEIVHMGTYVAWSESVPYAERPELPKLAESLETELRSVDVKFTIWQRGNTRTPRAQRSNPDTVRIRRDAQDAIKDMQFRPRFANRRWKRLRDVTMNYLYPPPL